MFSKATVAVLLQSGASLAAIVNVNVGGNKQLIFTPSQVKANAGDTVRFTFLDQNHTATAGNPNVGCSPSGQFNSGFVNVAANQQTKPTFDVAVQNTQPITVYCTQAQHCQVGMSMVINPTATGATSVNAYKALNAKAKKNTPAGAVNGGTLKGVQTQATAKAGGAKKAGKKAGKKSRVVALRERQAAAQAGSTAVAPAAAAGTAAATTTTGNSTTAAGSAQNAAKKAKKGKKKGKKTKKTKKAKKSKKAKKTKKAAGNAAGASAQTAGTANAGTANAGTQAAGTANSGTANAGTAQAGTQAAGTANAGTATN